MPSGDQGRYDATLSRPRHPSSEWYDFHHVEFTGKNADGRSAARFRAWRFDAAARSCRVADADADEPGARAAPFAARRPAARRAAAAPVKTKLRNRLSFKSPSENERQNRVSCACPAEDDDLGTALDGAMAQGNQRIGRRVLNLLDLLEPDSPIGPTGLLRLWARTHPVDASEPRSPQTSAEAKSESRASISMPTVAPAS